LPRTFGAVTDEGEAGEAVGVPVPISTPDSVAFPLGAASGAGFGSFAGAIEAIRQPNTLVWPRTLSVIDGSSEAAVSATSISVVVTDMSSSAAARPVVASAVKALAGVSLDVAGFAVGVWAVSNAPKSADRVALSLSEALEADAAPAGAEQTMGSMGKVGTESCMHGIPSVGVKARRSVAHQELKRVKARRSSSLS
jgi:hypothetical protein